MSGTTSLARVLRNPDIRKLWVCVGFGAVGAEAFSISIIWHVARASGPTGAYYLVPLRWVRSCRGSSVRASSSV